MTTHENNDAAVEYDEERGLYRAYFEEETDSPSLVLVEAVAAVKQVDSTSMKPLGRTTDMDALDTVVRSSSDDCDVQISLSYQEYQATIHTDGVIELRPIDFDVQPLSSAD